MIQIDQSYSSEQNKSSFQSETSSSIIFSEDPQLEPALSCKIPSPIIKVSCQNSQLTFNISCQNIKKDDNSYVRYYIIVNLSKQKTREIHRLINLFYQRMNLGDLIIIKWISTFSLKSSQWIQKTHNKKQIAQNLLFERQSSSIHLPHLLKKVFRDTKKFFTNLSTISLFVDYSPSNALLKQIQSQIRNQQYGYPFNIYSLLTTYRQEYLLQDIQPSLKVTYVYSLENTLNELFSNISKIRLMNLSIKLQCLDGSFRWLWQKNKLVKTIFQPKSYMPYRQSIMIQSMPKSVDILIEVVFVSMRGETYSTTGCLKILKSDDTRKSQSISSRVYSKNEQDNQKIYQVDSSSTKSISKIFYSNPQSIKFYKGRNLNGEI